MISKKKLKEKDSVQVIDIGADEYELLGLVNHMLICGLLNYMNCINNSVLLD